MPFVGAPSPSRRPAPHLSRVPCGKHQLNIATRRKNRSEDGLRQVAMGRSIRLAPGTAPRSRAGPDRNQSNGTARLRSSESLPDQSTEGNGELNQTLKRDSFRVRMTNQNRKSSSAKKKGSEVPTLKSASGSGFSFEDKVAALLFAEMLAGKSSLGIGWKVTERIERQAGDWEPFGDR